MGRAGAGGSSGSRSTGGHSSSRTSGGHRVGSSGSGRRAGAGTSFNHSFGGGHYGGGYHGGPRYDRGYGYGGPGPGPHYHRHYYGDGYHRSSLFATIVSSIVVLIIVLAVVFGAFGNTSRPKSTVNREKIASPVSFTNNCVVDELGWVDNVSKTETRLKNFYNKTGIQPYVVFHKYDADLKTDADKEAYANKYYSENIGNEGTFLFMYFAEANIDDVGYMCYVNGKQISTVMDAEAVDIFWNYMDSNWTSDKSTDDVIVDTFDSTANTIMKKSATAADVGVKVGGIILVIVIVGGVVIVMKVRRKNERERAAETERILNADIHGGVGNSPTDDLADRYTR